MKTCTGCHKTQPLTEFPRDKRSSDGRACRCNTCQWLYERRGPADHEYDEARVADVLAGGPVEDLPVADRIEIAVRLTKRGRTARQIAVLLNVDRRSIYRFRRWATNAGAVDLVTTKRCAHCKVVLPRAAYNRNGQTRDGLDHRCKACRAAYRAERLASIRHGRYDEAVVTRVVCGAWDGARKLTTAERREAVRRLSDRGLRVVDIAATVRADHRTVERDRAWARRTYTLTMSENGSLERVAQVA